jgi:hypothetical protein
MVLKRIYFKNDSYRKNFSSFPPIEGDCDEANPAWVDRLEIVLLMSMYD